MSDFNRGYSSTVTDRADMSVDAGLRSFMLGVYNKVALGLVLSAGLAYPDGQRTRPVRDLMFTVANGRVGLFSILGMVIAFAPLAVILFSAPSHSRMPRRSSAGITLLDHRQPDRRLAGRRRVALYRAPRSPQPSC